MVAMDYFTKWVEAEALASITPTKIKEFVYHNIICRYGVPHIIVLENAKQFDCNEFKKFYHKLQIKKSFSSVALPQANEQVEAVNKTIKHNLKTKLENLKGRWVDDLPEVLWAYRTTTRTPTGETFFSLSYGYEAMVPIEIGMSSLRRENYDKNDNHLLQRRELEFLEEKRSASQLRVAAY